MRFYNTSISIYDTLNIKYIKNSRKRSISKGKKIGASLLFSIFELTHFEFFSPCIVVEAIFDIMCIYSYANEQRT